MPFDSPDVNLQDLVKDIATGELQLPDFQREWKWDDDRIRSLLATISLGYPIGVVMTLEVGGDGSSFAPKPVAGSQFPNGVVPRQLVLDGQQRLTSLFQALASGKAVDTVDANGKRIRRWYYLDIAKALDPEGDREEAIISVPDDKRLKKDFDRVIVADYSTVDLECEHNVFPLAIAFDTSGVFSWHTTYSADASRAKQWKPFYDNILNNVVTYRIPVIILKKETPKEAVCTVFEKVNTGGIALNVFELMTATFAAEGFRLNDDWRKRKARLDTKAALKKLGNTDFLQAISLLATLERRRDHLKQDGDLGQAPGVSCKRRDILKLSLESYKRWADELTTSLEWAAGFLARRSIYRAEDVPYTTQLVPLAAVRAALGTQAETHAAEEKLERWFWCGVFGELYGGTTETRFARDVEQLTDWIASRTEALPNTVMEAAFQSARLLTLKTRNSAAYKGIFALIVARDPYDWVTHKQINGPSFQELAVDIHHIFPRSWCISHEISPARRESVINKTAISYSTNRSIGGRPPADYLQTIERAAGISAAEVDRYVSEHYIDPATLRANDFDAFFDHRRNDLIHLVESAIGKPVVRDLSEEDELHLYEPQDEDPAEEELAVV